MPRRHEVLARVIAAGAGGYRPDRDPGEAVALRELRELGLVRALDSGAWIETVS